MVIKASSGRELQQLVTALGADDDVRREAAIARLTVIGVRALERLFTAYEGAARRRTKVAILRVLESVPDPRTIPLARAALGEGGELAIAAAGALRGLLDARERPIATAALDTLVAVVLDGRADRQVRLAARDALQGMPPSITAPLVAALDADRALGPVPAGGPTDRAAAALWQDALDGRLPDTPAVLRGIAQDLGSQAKPGAVRGLIDAVRQREAATLTVAARDAWRGLRGALHQVLALRGSRIALYDLRESVADAHDPLGAPFMSALHAIGDASCLEAVAAAHAHARRGDDAWRQQLATAFRAIAKRERITRRHAVMKRIAARWPDTFDDLTAA